MKFFFYGLFSILIAILFLFSSIEVFASAKITCGGGGAGTGNCFRNWCCVNPVNRDCYLGGSNGANYRQPNGDSYCQSLGKQYSNFFCCVNPNVVPTPTIVVSPSPSPTPLPQCSSVNGICYTSRSSCVVPPNNINLGFLCPASGRATSYCCTGPSVPTPTTIDSPTPQPGSNGYCDTSGQCQKTGYTIDPSNYQYCVSQIGTGSVWCIPDTPTPADSGAGSIAGNPPITLPTIVCTNPGTNGSCNGIQTGVGLISTDAAKFINSIFTIILSLSGGIALILIIVSGYQLSLSSGNPEKVKEAQGMLTAAIVGFVFILFSVAILQIIGVDILGSILPTFGK